MQGLLERIHDNYLFLNLLNRSVAAGILVLAVLVLRLLLKKAPKWTHCVLWAFVALRLMIPVGIVSPLSVFSALSPQKGGSMEYFHGSGSGVNPIVEFDTMRIERPTDSDDILISIPNAGLAVTKHRANSSLPILETVWLAGFAGMLLYAMASLLRLRRRVAVSISAGDGVFVCDGIDTPFILGLLKPRIYLPSSLPEPKLSHVLDHERSHLARRDHWWKPLGFALLSIYWFHPLMWLAYFLFCRDIELACDERVLRKLDEPSRMDYSQSLLDLSRPRTALACPLAFGETGIKERIKAALHYKKPALWIVLAAAAVCVIAAVCFLTNPSYSTTVLPEEEQMLQQMMSTRGYSPSNLQTDVLYNRSGSAWCLLAVNGQDHMIVRRRGNKFMQSGNGNPYDGYMDVPKFYLGPGAYEVRGKDAKLDRPIGDNQFYDLRQEKSAGYVGYAARRVPYPENAAQELPQPIQGSLLQITCVNQFGTFESLCSSTEWNDDGTYVSSEGEDAADVIRNNKDLIPGGVDEAYSDDCSDFYVELTNENAELVEDGLTVYWEASVNPVFNYADITEESWRKSLRSHGPGRYWCCQEVLVRGEYVPGANEYNTTRYYCIFYLDVLDEPDTESKEYLELFGDYPSVQAKELSTEPVVVVDEKMRIYNKSLLNDFCTKVQAGTPADVMLAFYVSDKEYVLEYLRYDGSQILLKQDFSRDGTASTTPYQSSIYSYALMLKDGKKEVLLLSDEYYEDYEAYEAAYQTAYEQKKAFDKSGSEDVADAPAWFSWIQHSHDIILYWQKTMPE